MKKVSELTGAELDYWVAKAGGLDADIVVDGGYSPSSRWIDGGPIIELSKIDIEYRSRQKKWFAIHFDEKTLSREWGETALIAAMRVFVSIKYGQEVGQ